MGGLTEIKTVFTAAYYTADFAFFGFTRLCFFILKGTQAKISQIKYEVF